MNWRKHFPKWQYTSEDYPELDLFPEGDRRTVARGYNRSKGWWIGLLSGALGVLVVSVSNTMIQPLISKAWPSAPRMVSGVIAGMYLGLVLSFFIKSFYGLPYRKYLRSELNKRGIRVCMSCGYDLTGNTSGVCPECGAAVSANSVTSVSSCSTKKQQEQTESTEE